MKPIWKQLQLILLSAMTAAYLRMFFPGISWESWHDLTHEPWLRWIARALIALLLLPVFELLHFWYAYLLASLMFALVARKLFPGNQHWVTYLLLAGLPVMLWLILSLFNEPYARHRLSLLTVYEPTALLYGFLYHHYFVKVRQLPQPETPAEQVS